MAYVTHDSKGNPRRESNPWIEDSLEKEIKRLKEEKKHLEEVFLEIMENIKKIQKRKNGSERRIEKLKNPLPEMKNRHYNMMEVIHLIYLMMDGLIPIQEMNKEEQKLL